MSVDSLSSNVTGLAYAEEVSPKELPEPAANTVWFDLEPNSYGTFGAEPTTMRRQPIRPGRRLIKGVITDIEPEGEFNNDLTQTNFLRLLQGFFFNDVYEKPTTAPMNDTQISVFAVTESGSTVTISGGLQSIDEGHIVLLEGFTNSANNGVFVVTATDEPGGDGQLTLDGSLVDETPPSEAKITVVGFEFSEGDLSMAMVGSLVTVVSAADITNFADDLNLRVGEWLFVGGDGEDHQFSDDRNGYARISAIDGDTLTFDKVTFDPAANAGTGKEIQIYFGRVYMDDTDNPVKRTYSFERRLGNPDGQGIQAQYLDGCVLNTLTVNVPPPGADAKINCDVGLMPMSPAYRTSSQGPRAGSHVAALAEDAINTASDIYRIHMNLLDPNTATPSPFFAYLSDFSISINNNGEPNKAIGVVGSFNVTEGDFEVGGEVSAFFTTVEAIAAVAQNADVSIDLIAARENAGFVFDIPLVTLGGGVPEIERNQPIMLPLESFGAENMHGYTLAFTFYPYLPNLAMPADQLETGE